MTIRNRPTAGRRRLVGAGILASVGALAACTSTSASTPAASTSPSPSISPSTSPSPSPKPVVPTGSWLSGRPGGTNGAVLAVKLDNTPRSEPHAGLLAADLVYLEEVEGGLSRYVAVFSSQYPKTVGPIRSARISDIELLAQYGRVAFAYSGAQSKMLPVLANANISNVSADSGGVGYRRDSRWREPDNLFADPKVLFTRSKRVSIGHDVGFRFSDAVPAGGKSVTKVAAKFPATSVSFTWDSAKGRWLVVTNGTRSMAAEGGQLGGSTVIIQYVSVSRSIYHDVLGNYTPLSRTVGSGKALMMRNGQAYSITWSRPSASAGTRWMLGGKDIALAPGQVWVLLINKDHPAVIS